MELRTRSKVNLTLFITGKREDGYHSVDLIFQPLTLGDTLKAEPAGAFSFSCSDPALEIPENLAVKAAGLLCRTQAQPDKVRLELKKQVPSQAGLGGGSGDAAAALTAVSEVLELGLSRPRLEELAASLGADVPALLRQGPSRGRGRGTEIRPLASRADLFFLILKPASACPTALMYRAWDERREAAVPPAQAAAHQSAMEEALRTGDVKKIAALLYNDFEKVLPPEAAADHKKAKELLISAGALNALLCGSGSAVFGLFAGEEEREAARRSLAGRLPDGWQLYACEGTKEAPAVCDAVIAAGGSGTRFGSPQNKIFASLKGRPVLSYSLRVFMEHPAVRRIVIPCRPEDEAGIRQIAEETAAALPGERRPELIFAAGGQTRQESVRNALAHIREKLVLIHDAARPFLKPRALDDCLEALRDYPAVSLAVPSRDTVKLTNERGEVLETTDRPNTWLVQTPQGFDRALLEEAHRRFAKRPVTDDCTLMEQAGRDVKLVMGDYGNRKITVPEDLE